MSLGAYNDIQHTQTIALNSHFAYFDSTADLESVYESEGAYKIGLLFCTVFGSAAICEITIRGQKFFLKGTEEGAQIIIPNSILWLDGSVDTIRTDIINYKLTDLEPGDGLMIISHRIGEKKTDNLYPAILP